MKMCNCFEKSRGTVGVGEGSEIIDSKLRDRGKSKKKYTQRSKGS